jgi:hypothetical protein
MQTPFVQNSKKQRHVLRRTMLTSTHASEIRIVLERCSLRRSRSLILAIIVSLESDTANAFGKTQGSLRADAFSIARCLTDCVRVGCGVSALSVEARPDNSTSTWHLRQCSIRSTESVLKSLPTREESLAGCRDHSSCRGWLPLSCIQVCSHFWGLR